MGDFIHVHPTVVGIIFRYKGLSKGISKISDAIVAAGLQPGSYTFAGREITVDKNKISLLHDGTIAGSTFLMKDVFKNVVKKRAFQLKRLFS